MHVDQNSEAPTNARLREISLADLEAITDLLTSGFPGQSRGCWERALDLLSQRAPVPGFPKYGFMLEAEGMAVGVLLLISSQLPNSDTVRSNGSSWYVKPAFRNFAPLLIMKSLRLRSTHTNITPGTHTLPILHALGLSRYCEGAVAALPALAAPIGKTKITRVGNVTDGDKIPAAELQLLRDHENFGCLSLWCETEDEGSPFIFRRHLLEHLYFAPCAELIYCSSIDNFVRVAGPIGRYLALRGMPFVIVPANGPIPGLIGKYLKARYMYYSGDAPPRLGDLAYTEKAIFGF